ncbi:MAG TPA: cysteine rich repeat-containing protein [Pseudolabrys sp.]|nr:cysteine rich repeat-containing protein [Pseudolabrys sp.]
MTSIRLQSATSAAALLTLALLAQSASAQPSAPQQAAIRQHCRTDFTTLCAGLKPGGSEAIACLGKNMERLSPACQDAVYAILPEEPAKAASEKEAPAFEPAAPRATSRHIAITSAPPPPLRDPHHAVAEKQKATTSVAAAPAEAPPMDEPAVKPIRKTPAVRPVAKAKLETQHKLPRTAHVRVDTASTAIRTCRPDLIRFCRNVRPGGGREFACLASHRILLTRQCRTALADVSRGRAMLRH